LQEVVAARSRIADKTVTLVISGAMVQSTEEHPFWKVGSGWTPAAELRLGDRLVGLSRETETLESLSFSTNSTRVFNLEVRDSHTYFVSTNAVLVHNACVWANRLPKIPKRSGV